MATVRELQSKAKKLLARWRREAAPVLKNDRRSPCSYLCLTILMRNNSMTNARNAEAAIRKRFVDWNEVRVSPIAEVMEALESAKAPSAEQKAYALRRFLRDLFSKFTKTNLQFDLMELPEIRLPLAPGEEKPVEPGREPVSRESGLPPHLTIPGFLDMRRILDQITPLDAKLITEKNSLHTADIAWDDAERAPFSAIWKVALLEKLVLPILDARQALQRMRQIAPDKERNEFAFYAILHAIKNWTVIRPKADSMRKKIRAAAAKAEKTAAKAKAAKGRKSKRK